MLFKDFMKNKDRIGQKYLKILENVLKQGGLKVENFLDTEEPYLFVYSNKDLSFDGIRLYKIGDVIAYKTQKENNTHPYGQPYLLNVEDIFNDLISDDKEPEKAGDLTAKYLVEELNKFFSKSFDAEENNNDSQISRADSLGRVVIDASGIDYAASILNKV